MLFQPFYELLKFFVVLFNKLQPLAQLPDGCILGINTVEDVVHDGRICRCNPVSVAPDDTPWNSHYHAVGGNIFVHNGVRADLAVIADGDRPEDLRAHANENAVAYRRMALRLIETGTSEGDLVVHQHVVSNDRSLTDDHAGSVIDEQPPTDGCAGMNLYTREKSRQLGKRAGGKLAVPAPQRMRKPVEPESIQTLVQQNLQEVPRGRVFGKYRLYVFA